jgi:hypothetical protein
MTRALVVLLSVVGAGCFRTSYYHLQPEPPTPVPAVARIRPDSRWRHFFLYGWIPSEMVIPAGSRCGGAEHVAEIRTRQTFLQGLVAELASYYVNIYSPYTGEVLCAGDHAE